MSFWGATVITFFSAIPFVSEHRTFLWGGFSVDNPTLNRFFSLHYLMPFLIAGVVVLHIVALHRFGSNNPIGIDATGPQDTIFHPYYTIQVWSGLRSSFATDGCVLSQMQWAIRTTIFGQPMRTRAYCRNGISCRSMPFCEQCLTSLEAFCVFTILCCSSCHGWIVIAVGASARCFASLAALHRLPCAWLSRWYAGRRYLCPALPDCHCLVLLALLAILPLLSVFETTRPLPKSISEPVWHSQGN